MTAMTSIGHLAAEANRLRARNEDLSRQLAAAIEQVHRLSTQILALQEAGAMKMEAVHERG